MWSGRILGIQIAPAAGAAMIALDQIEAVAGQGLRGDRYFGGGGTFSQLPGGGRQVTLVEAEALEALAREAALDLDPAATRRNITTRGVPLNDLVGRRFRLGDVVLEGVRLCEPCAHLQKLTRPGVLKGLAHRGGLRADIAVGGIFRVGDLVSPEGA